MDQGESPIARLGGVALLSVASLLAFDGVWTLVYLALDHSHLLDRFDEIGDFAAHAAAVGIEICGTAVVFAWALYRSWHDKECNAHLYRIALLSGFLPIVVGEAMAVGDEAMAGAIGFPALIAVLLLQALIWRSWPKEGKGFSIVFVSCLSTVGMALGTVPVPFGGVAAFPIILVIYGMVRMTQLGVVGTAADWYTAYSGARSIMAHQRRRKSKPTDPGVGDAKTGDQ